MSKHPILIACLLAAATTTTASAQLLGGVTQPVTDTIGQVGGTIGDTVADPIGSIGDPTISGVTGMAGGQRGRQAVVPISLDRVTQPIGAVTATAGQLAQLRKERLALLIKTYRKELDRDEQGQPVRKGQLIVADPNPASLSVAARAGFRVIADEQLGELGLRIVTLAIPRGMTAREGMSRLRAAAPELQADYNHVFEPAGGALSPVGRRLAASAPVPGTRIAMIDGGVASHPSLARAGIEQRGFAGPAQPTGHGTAIGSLLVGDQGSFRGAARGAQLFVGDVYGGSPAAGSATTIIRALGWAASKKPAVINISLVGPGNHAMARAIAAIQARRIAVVAAVGNDGPAAPHQYPASYPGVIAVTGVDGRDRALREAGRSAHLDFAAPGADLVAALPGNGYTPVRGTSFAAPFVAARLAATGSTARLAAEAVPGKGKVGRGIVCRACRVLPKMVGIR